MTTKFFNNRKLASAIVLMAAFQFGSAHAGLFDTIRRLAKATFRRKQLIEDTQDAQDASQPSVEDVSIPEPVPPFNGELFKGVFTGNELAGDQPIIPKFTREHSQSQQESSDESGLNKQSSDAFSAKSAESSSTDDFLKKINSCGRLRAFHETSVQLNAKDQQTKNKFLSTNWGTRSWRYLYNIMRNNAPWNYDFLNNEGDVWKQLSKFIPDILVAEKVTEQKRQTYLGAMRNTIRHFVIHEKYGDEGSDWYEVITQLCADYALNSEDFFQKENYNVIFESPEQEPEHVPSCSYPATYREFKDRCKRAVIKMKNKKKHQHMYTGSAKQVTHSLIGPCYYKESRRVQQ